MSYRQLWKSGLLAAGIALVLLAIGIPQEKAPPASVTASWSYNYGHEPACSEDRRTRCIDHFEIVDLTDPNKVSVIQKVDNPAPALGRVSHISATFRYGPPFGRRLLGVAAIGRNARGERVSSNPYAARAIVVIRTNSKAAVSFTKSSPAG